MFSPLQRRDSPLLLLGKAAAVLQGAEGGEGEAHGLGSQETFVAGPAAAADPVSRSHTASQPPAPSASAGHPNCAPPPSPGLSSARMGALSLRVWALTKPAHAGGAGSPTAGARVGQPAPEHCVPSGRCCAGLRSRLCPPPGEAIPGARPQTQCREGQERPRRRLPMPLTPPGALRPNAKPGHHVPASCVPRIAPGPQWHQPPWANPPLLCRLVAAQGSAEGRPRQVLMCRQPWPHRGCACTWLCNAVTRLPCDMMAVK